MRHTDYLIARVGQWCSMLLHGFATVSLFRSVAYCATFSKIGTKKTANLGLKTHEFSGINLCGVSKIAPQGKGIDLNDILNFRDVNDERGRPIEKSPQAYASFCAVHNFKRSKETINRWEFYSSGSQQNMCVNCVPLMNRIEVPFCISSSSSTHTTRITDAECRNIERSEQCTRTMNKRFNKRSEEPTLECTANVCARTAIRSSLRQGRVRQPDVRFEKVHK